MKRKGIKVVLVGLIVLGLFSALVMVLWNALVPAILGLGTINYLQALGLFFLARILFGGFGVDKLFMGGMFHHHHHHKNPMKEKWMNMTPEQRKDFIRRRREFGFGHPFNKPDFFQKGDFENNDNRDPHFRNDQA